MIVPFALDDAAEMTTDPEIKSQLERMHTLANTALEEIHRLILDLRPTMLDHLGLIPALRWYAESRFSEIEIGFTLRETGEPRRTLTLVAPASGVIIKDPPVAGMRFMPGEPLFRIADLSRIWVNAELYEQDLPWVKIGQGARVELAYGSRKVFEGKVDYIYPYLEGMTRTVKARIVFENPGLELKPDMYANVEIATEAVKGVLAVPANAILRSGQGSVVFVAKSDGKFDPRSVETGASGDDGYVQIRSGLVAGDQVVTSAQFMLDSESKLREAIKKMIEPQAPAAAIAVASVTKQACAGFAPMRQLSVRSGHSNQQPVCGSNSAGMRKPSAWGFESRVRDTRDSSAGSGTGF